jgi:hypothetical protein
MNTFQRIETATKHAVILRNYQRARGRALTRLANAHPEEYKTYLKEEQLNDEAQGKKWLNINGDTSADMDSHSASRDKDSHTQALSTENEGDL